MVPPKKTCFMRWLKGRRLNSLCYFLKWKWCITDTRYVRNIPARPFTALFFNTRALFWFLTKHTRWLIAKHTRWRYLLVWSMDSMLRKVGIRIVESSRVSVWGRGRPGGTMACRSTRNRTGGSRNPPAAKSEKEYRIDMNYFYQPRSV